MTTGWADGPMIGFDLETTSPLPTEARIVTASVVTVRPGEETVTRDWLADPDVDIPTEATEIHGITTEHAREHGQPAANVVTEVAIQLVEGWQTGAPVVIYNAPYDLTVLYHELIRHGSTTIATAFGPVIDCLVIDKHVDRYRRGKRTLTACCEHYGIPLTDAHTSTADALATTRLAWKLAHRYPQIGKMTLTELQTAQAGWYCEAQHSFADYLRNNIATQVRREATQLIANEQEAKLAEVRDILTRADAVDADADGWPLRRAS